MLATRLKEGAEVRGDPAHPANRGKLCVKGTALGETLSLDGRLLYPQLRGERASWDEAIATVAGEFRRCIDRYGPESVAFYVSGQLLTEDYYVANKLMKGYIGAANIDTNSRLCMASAVAGHRRAFGEDVVPVSYEDLDATDLVVLVGSNTAWCHPVLLQRLTAARERRPRMKIVAIDPRRTATTQLADLHLPLAPGTDVHLFNGLLVWLAEHGHLDRAFVERHTTGACRRWWRRAPAAARWRRRRRHCGLDDRLAAAVLRAVCAHTGGDHGVFPGREPELRGHRQGQRHHQLPSRHRPDRQTGRRTVLGHRAAQCHGRPRGGRFREHAGGAHRPRG